MQHGRSIRDGAPGARRPARLEGTTLATVAQRFWAWYGRHYVLNLSVATGLFLLQAFHLYWLTTDVVLRRIYGHTFFSFPPELWPLYVFIDYTEIPALIATSAVYLHSLGKRNTVQAWLALGALNIQWVHLFWITDEIVAKNLSGVVPVGLPVLLSWIAIGIDYLELPVMVDTVRRLLIALRGLVAGRDVELWREHWQSEGDAAYVYRRLALAERDARRAEIYAQLAEVEDRHLERWASVLATRGVVLGRHHPSLRVQILTLIGRIVGWQLPATILLAEEGRETTGYLRGTKEYTDPRAVQAASDLAKESADHADQLSTILGVSREPWHHPGGPPDVAHALNGFTTGAMATFGMVMALVGAGRSAETVALSGLAGLVALALAMGTGRFLTARSLIATHAREQAIEREELRLMPDLERAELRLLYQTRGLSSEAASRAAEETMRDPEHALVVKTQMELGMTDPTGSPAREGWFTALAAAGGGLAPVLPFLLSQGATVPAAASALSTLALFAAGASRAVFDGRDVVRSGLEVAGAGLAIALVAFLLGIAGAAVVRP